MLTSLTTRILIALSINIGLISFAPDAYAKPCECKDIGAITAEIQRVSTAEEIWKEIYSWSRGLLKDVARPKSNDELNTKFLQLARAPRTDWRRIVREPIQEVEKPATAGGLDDNGEPVVNDDYAQSHCDTMVRGVQTHELAHADFFRDPVNFSFATSTQLLRLRAESEVVSYRAQKEYLVKKLEELEKKCQKLSFKGVTIDCTIRTPPA
jgi:hypothetical protein